MTPTDAIAPTRLRVAIDGLPFLGQRTGIGHMTANLARALESRTDVEVVAYAIGRAATRELPPALPAGVRAGISPVPARLVHPCWRLFARPRIDRWTGPVDVVHGTNYAAPPARAPIVITVHDLTFVHRPDLVFDDTRRDHAPAIQDALDRGATVHVVSDFVGAEVRDAFGLPPERVVRVYPGLADTEGGDPVAGRERADAARYVLALGQLEPRKNLPALVRAFDRVAAHTPDLDLVVAGPDGWGRDEFDAAIGHARHGGRVHWLGYVSDAERRDLLAGAALLAYPSLYEGFGHPPLEAMAAGVPVVAARSGAIPEVVDDAALLVTPDDDQQLAECIDSLVHDEALRAQLVDAGKRRAATFDWETAASNFVALYREVASRR